MDRLSNEKPAPAEEIARAAFEALPRARITAALVGGAIQESRTPRMHMTEGARLGLDYSYALIDFDAFGLPEQAIGDVLKLAGEFGLAGLNVTHPFKQCILPELDALSAEAAAIGAVNTVVFADGKAIGHNTDCWGFAESCRRAMPDADRSCVLLLGAGGAGKAVAHALVGLGADEILVFDLDDRKAASLAASLASQERRNRALPVRDLAEAARQAAGIVNATPMGMSKYPGAPLPLSMLRPDLWVADIVYFPAETELLRAARAAGCRTMAGRGMAVFQAVKAFELITGVKPDAEAMFRHFDAAAGHPAAPPPRRPSPAREGQPD